MSTTRKRRFYDIVSATYGLGKVRACKELYESYTWRDIMCIVGDDDVDRKYMIERGEKFTWNYTASSVRRQIFLITFVNYVYNAEIHTNISHASQQQSVSILYAICAFRAEHFKNLWQVLEDADYGFKRNTDEQLIPIITDKEACTHLSSSRYEM